MPISCFGGLLIPGLQGLMTRRVQPNEQGQLQGASQSLAGLASMIGPLIFGLAFAWAVNHKSLGIPGLPLWLAASALGACLLLAFKAAPRASAA